MTVLFDYPVNAAFGRVLPKNKIYEHANPTPALKALFVSQVDQITWKYKLAPETINLSATKAVPEIQIFQVSLKGQDLKDDVLRCIDKAIPFPLVFEVRQGDLIKVVAAYKRVNEVDSSKWVFSDYFASDWQGAETKRSSLPIAINLGALYEQMISQLLPYPALPHETLANHIDRIENIRTKQQDQGRLEVRLRNEKQFNRKVAMNAELRSISNQISTLIAATGTTNN